MTGYEVLFALFLCLAVIIGIIVLPMAWFGAVYGVCVILATLLFLRIIFRALGWRVW